MARIPAYRQAQMEIKRFIEANKLGLGDALPPEAALAKQLGISRPSLREGVKALESLGIVEARHGEGVFVSAFSFDTIIENLPYSIVADGKKLVDLLQVRAALEVGIVDQVADKIGDEDRRLLREIAAQMAEKARLGQTFEQEDSEFHKTLYRCLNNPFLSRLVDLFWQVFHRMHKADSLHIDQRSLVSSAADHMRVVDLIDAKNKPGLVAAHQKHFEDIFVRLREAHVESDGPPVAAVQAHMTPVTTLDLSGRLDGYGKS